MCTRPPSRTTRRSVWAAEEIKKRTNGKFDIQVFPASTLGKETDINQGMQLGTVDMIISGPSFAARSYPAPGHRLLPVHLPRRRPPAGYSKSDVFKEMSEGSAPRPASRSRRTPTTARATPPPRSHSPTATGMKGLKIRVPDVPAYTATPKACGANPTPIAFAEVYLALAERHGGCAGEPADHHRGQEVLRSAKGHHADRPHRGRADHPGGPSCLDQADRPDKSDVHRSHARGRGARATAQIKKREAELVDEFKKKGLQIVQVDRKSFQDAVLKSSPLESMGFTKADFDKIQAAK
jgi:TRAP-type C4-dicarboxylate transport system substrate-binding protein